MGGHLRPGQHLQHLPLTVRHLQSGCGCAHNAFYQVITDYFGDMPLVALGTASNGTEVVVWRWCDTVVLGAETGLVRM